MLENKYIRNLTEKDLQPQYILSYKEVYYIPSDSGNIVLSHDDVSEIILK